MSKPKIKWADSFTTTTPPVSKRVKTSKGNRHTRKEWDRWRSRIEELYTGNNYKLGDVQQTLESEGFTASTKQLRDHLNAWGDNSRYLTFSEPQWRYIASKSVLRHAQDPSKRTAFRIKGSGEPLPFANIERNLERKLAQPAFWDTLSLCQTVGSYGLSAYTSSSNGIQISARALKYAITTGLWGLVKAMCQEARSMAADLMTPPLGTHELIRLEDRAHVVEQVITELRIKYPDDRFEYQEGSYPPRLRRPVGSVDAIACHDCPAYAYSLAFDMIDATVAIPFPLEDNTSSRTEFGTEDHFSYLEETGHAFGYFKFGQGLEHELDWFIEDRRSATKEFLGPELCLKAGDINRSIAHFEAHHLLNPYHQKRVQLRILGNPPQWDGRNAFFKQTGLTCGHDQPPETFCKNESCCWSAGGCRWSQFKTVEENAMKEFILEQAVAAEEEERGDAAFSETQPVTAAEDYSLQGASVVRDQYTGTEDKVSSHGPFGSDVAAWSHDDLAALRDFRYDRLARWNDEVPDEVVESLFPGIVLPKPAVDQWHDTLDETIANLENIP